MGGSNMYKVNADIYTILKVADGSKAATESDSVKKTFSSREEIEKWFDDERNLINWINDDTALIAQLDSFGNPMITVIETQEVFTGLELLTKLCNDDIDDGVVFKGESGDKIRVYTFRGKKCKGNKASPRLFEFVDELLAEDVIWDQNRLNEVWFPVKTDEEDDESGEDECW